MRRITGISTPYSFTLNSKFSTVLSNDTIYVVKGIAFGEYSHSEGNQSLAIGNYSHAEGDKTKTLGQSAHASGEYSEANKQASFAAGYRAIANNQIGEIALGKNNISSPDTMLSVGIGTDSQKKNALEINTSGDVFIKGIGDYDGISKSGAISLQQKILDIDTAASTAIEQINAASDLKSIKQAMINFIQSFRNQ